MSSGFLHKSCQSCPWGSKLVMPQWSLASIDLTWEKTLEIIFSKAMRPLAYIFSILQCIVFPYVNPVNRAPGVRIGHSMGVIFYHRLVIKKTLKIFSETIRLTTQVSSIGSLSLLFCYTFLTVFVAHCVHIVNSEIFV